jgi:hypothetical protein
VAASDSSRIAASRSDADRPALCRRHCSRHSRSAPATTATPARTPAVEIVKSNYLLLVKKMQQKFHFPINDFHFFPFVFKEFFFATSLKNYSRSKQSAINVLETARNRQRKVE